MQLFATDHHPVPLPDGHRFPMGKYASLRRRLVGEQIVPAAAIAPAPPAPLEAVERAHDPAYVRAFLAGALPGRAMRRIGFPWSPALVARTLASVGGTLAAARAARESGFAGSLAGGTHHADRAEGAGYCVFNDLAVAALDALADGWACRVLVIDVDVHQGDGTARLFAGDARVFTFSIHGARNFPLRKARSDLDVALPDGTGDDAYLAAFERGLATAFDRARPDLALVQAGVDVLAEDRLGRLALTRAGVARRDAHVFGELRRRGVPAAATLGGGYAEPIEASVEAHAGTWRAAREIFGAR